MNAYIESGGVEMGDGEQFMFINRMIPDFELEALQPVLLDITLKGKDFPLNDTTTLLRQMLQKTLDSRLSGQEPESL